MLGQSLALAQIYADFITSKGNFTCVLYHEVTPRTVGNFISLAQGSRRWIDERDGRLSDLSKRESLYKNVTFHRVINQDNFKIIQAGSLNGLGTDGPGYTFPDEMFTNRPQSYQFNTPYLLAMANSGGNTNGSQFFITGNAIPGLEGKHTVFGKVVSNTAIVDQILNVTTNANDAPVTPVTIQTIRIRRMGESALLFNIAAQHLPEVTHAPFRGVRFAAPNDNYFRFYFNQGAQTELRVWDLLSNATTWRRFDARWYGKDSRINRFIDLSYDRSNLVSNFRPRVIRYYKDAYAPTTMRGWALRFSNAEGQYVFEFPSSGSCRYQFTDQDTNTTSSDVLDTEHDYAEGFLFYPDGYGAYLYVYPKGRSPLRLRLCFDAKTGLNLSGRQVSSSGVGINWTEIAGNSGFLMSPLN